MVKVEYTSTDQSVRVFDNQVQVDAMHTKSALLVKKLVKKSVKKLVKKIGEKIGEKNW